MIEPVILIVADEPNIVRLCQRSLERMNYQVITATSPIHALVVISRQQVDLLIVDIRLHEMNGFQLITQARHLQPGIAAIAMTGYATIAEAVSVFQEDINGFLLKPFSETELLQQVHQAFKRNQEKLDAQRLQVWQSFFDITTTWFDEKEPDKINDLIVKTIVDHFQCASVYLFARSSPAGLSHLISYVGETLPDAEMDSDESWQQVFSAIENPVYFNRNGINDLRIKKVLTNLEINAIICVPFGNEYQGYMLCATRKESQGTFDDGDLRGIVVVARQAFVAIENAVSFARLRSQIIEHEESRSVAFRAEKSASTSRLTATIAHEINNPLQSLSNCIHLAGRKELPARERRKYLTMAQGELERLQGIVERMLSYYRPMTHDRKPTNINVLVRHVLALMDQQIAINHVHIQTKLSPSLPPVMIVADQIEEVLMNLIINSLEAMHQGGDLLFETNPITLEIQSASESETIPGIELILSDTGPGLPLKVQERLFEPFVSTKEKGTGLGLFVSYGIVTAHGGALSLMKTWEKGASFRITLPKGDLS